MLLIKVDLKVFQSMKKSQYREKIIFYGIFIGFIKKKLIPIFNTIENNHQDIQKEKFT